ncbi:MAG TPA: hypothetical protein VK988_12320 [Acidimicrobiales bacterium]|nr:hypothetical protein [Acidimicrobiales bacterium]
MSAGRETPPVVGFLAGLLAAAFAMGGLLLAAGGIRYVLGLLLVGVVVAALGRAVAPRANGMGVGTTLLASTGGSFLGGFVGWFAFGDGGRLPAFVLSVAGAGFVVWLVQNQDGAASS